MYRTEQSCRNPHKVQINSVIFLDFDGVLNRGGTGHQLRFMPERVEGLIETIRETDSLIVVSSSWNMFFNDQQLSLLLMSHGLDPDWVIGATDDNLDRTDAILKFVETYGVKRWVAIDDLFLLVPYPHFSQSIPRDGPNWDDVKKRLNLQLDFPDETPPTN